ncbi:S-adenosyl-L-methionine-dependent methyltransferase [Ostreococcus tauri]|uniref:S-adenosyl-L-methionine-dependent methyltransferase n=1 Tax=Ostreococcus tauri TaxID=70448 RepID=A0A1Y5I679_OSTTA|nr:S-adenosyl-L-methionine-dependent methyltransferase [Ostreococcus tauri]
MSHAFERARATSTSASLARTPRNARHANASSRRFSRARASASDDAEAWEKFYAAHSRNGASADVRFFKDRHYLRRAFGELVDADARAHPETFRAALDPKTLGDLGCGVGNSVYPLIRANLNMRVTAVDCSPTAVATLEKSPEFDPRRVRALVVDASEVNSMVGRVNDASMDAVTAVFFLSALTASGMRNVAEEVRRVLRPNGVLLFRDYARGDVKNAGDSSQFVPGLRVDSATESDQMYRRGDGTLAVFFEPSELNEVFVSVGLVGACEIVSHTVTNRKLGVTMERRFVQGRFVKPAS